MTCTRARHRTQARHASRIFAALLIALGGAACGPVEGPSGLLEERLEPGMGRNQIVEILGPPAVERTLEDYQPQVQEIGYPQWGITASFTSGGTLRYLDVTRRWTTPIHGVTVGDEIAELRRTLRLVPASGYHLALHQEAHPNWLVFLDEAGERVEKIQLANPDAPLYYPIPR